MKKPRELLEIAKAHSALFCVNGLGNQKQIYEMAYAEIKAYDCCYRC